MENDKVLCLHCDEDTVDCVVLDYRGDILAIEVSNDDTELAVILKKEKVLRMIKFLQLYVEGAKQ